jgi:two-component system invasion response regulator UvrY
MKLLLVDDHPIVRAGLKRLLASSPEIAVSEVATGRDALVAYRQDRPDIVMLDLNLPGIGGLELLRRLLIDDPAVRVLIFTMHAEPIYATQALQAGAKGFVSKSAPPEEILEAVARVASGGHYIEHEIAQELALRSVPADAGEAQLSPRDMEILRLLAQGQSLAEIAQAIGISYKTVANTMSQIKAKLGVQRTAELVRIAIETGIAGA